MRQIRNTLRSACAVVLLTGMLAACGGAPASDSGASAAPTAQATEAAPTTDTGGAATTAPQASPAATAQPAQATEAAPTTDTGGAATTAPQASPAATAQPAATADSAPAMTKLNLNTATEDQLRSTIPDFPSRMVREFFEYRPYISISQFRQEIGKYVSQEQVAAYEQYVYVPIDVDASDAATLQQIPGVEAAIAEQLIAGRPYGTQQAFLDALAGTAPAVDLQLAAAYLAE
jgi:hypothetical protein